MSSVQTETLLSKIHERGYWSVVIRPDHFDKSKLDLNSLFPLIEKKAVWLRKGCSYPFANSRAQPRKGPDWVEQECNLHPYLEVWRIYQSGQFLHDFGIPSDWLDQSPFGKPEPAENWRWGQTLDYLDTLYTFTEIFEFAARLALSEAGSPRMHVEIQLKRLRDRRLTDGTGRVLFKPFNRYQCHQDEWEYPLNEPQIVLIADARLLAAKAARDLFEQCFSLDVSIDTLTHFQESIGGVRS